MTLHYSIAQLFKTMVDQGASDLHILTHSPPRLRIDGRMLPLDLPPLTAEDTHSLCHSIMNESQKKSLEEHKEVDFSFQIKGLARFRANVFHSLNHISGAFRLIPSQILSLEQLALPEVLKDICHQPNGLVLVTGPTGSGKSTTLAAMIDAINSQDYGHIITIEDPIEFVHHNKNSIINQREVGDDTHSFARALKSALRQDPDVVLLGEMRDLETVHAALTIAETGHLVFATLHTNNCISSINRIIDVFPSAQQSQIRTQLAMTLRAVLSQVLIPKNGGGRTMAMEIMRVNAPIRSLIIEGKINQIYSAMQTGQAETQMQTMNQSLYRLVKQNLISKEAALDRSQKVDELQEFFSKSKP